MQVVSTKRVARKPHYCEVCGPNINPGDTYHRVITFDGDVFTWKNCEPCNDAITQAREEGYGDDDLITGDQVREWSYDRMGLYDAANGVRHRIARAEAAA